MSETAERSKLEEIPESECRRLLVAHQLGRLSVVVQGQPQIFPVNYAMDDQVIVFRTGPGTKLSLAPMSKVAFEIDEYDPSTRGGWSVMVQVLAHEVTALPVMNREEVVGIISERDLVDALIDGSNAGTTRVSACMTPHPWWRGLTAATVVLSLLLSLLLCIAWWHDAKFGAIMDIGILAGLGLTTLVRSPVRAWPPTPWGGRFGNYKKYGGIRIPGSAEVFWELPEGESTYFRGEILDAGLLATPRAGRK